MRNNVKSNKAEIINELSLFDGSVENSKTLDEKFDYIIIAFKRMYYSGRTISSIDTVYNHVKNYMIKLVIDNNLDSEEEWEKIKQCFITKTNQYFGSVDLNITTECLEKLKEKSLKIERDKSFDKQFINILHPRISAVCLTSFNSGEYANSVENGCKEINSRLKKIYKKISGIEDDGDSLFSKLFSANKPILKFEDISTKSGINAQRGFMQMFQGMWAALRDPKAHENLQLTKEKAIDRLIFLSMLMKKIDDALVFSNIIE